VIPGGNALQHCDLVTAGSSRLPLVTTSPLHSDARRRLLTIGRQQWMTRQHGRWRLFSIAVLDLERSAASGRSAGDVHFLA